MDGQEIIYTEAFVPAYELPDLLMERSGRPVAAPEAWQQRRAETLQLLEQQMDGRVSAGSVEKLTLPGGLGKGRTALVDQENS